MYNCEPENPTWEDVDINRKWKGIIFIAINPVISGSILCGNGCGDICDAVYLIATSSPAVYSLVRSANES
jgi:hypothetical protein